MNKNKIASITIKVTQTVLMEWHSPYVAVLVMITMYSVN